MSEIEQFEQQVKAQLGLKRFELELDRQGNIELVNIESPRDARGQGTGTAALKALTDYADRTGALIWLSVADRDSKTGTTSRARLVKFYRQFGFVPNKGRNKRFELSLYANMYRDPKGLQEEINMIRRRAGLPMINESIERADVGSGKTVDLIVEPNKQDLDQLARMVVQKLAGRKPPDGSHVKGFFNPTSETVWIWDGTAATHGEVGSYLIDKYGWPEAEDWQQVTGETEVELQSDEEGGYIPIIMEIKEGETEYSWWVPYENVFNHPAMRALK